MNIKDELVSRNVFIICSLVISICKDKICFYYRWPGRAHDSHVWHKSPLYEELPDLCYYVEGLCIDETFHLIGDSAYPLSNYLLVPFKKQNNLTDKEKKFNTHLASKRSVIEHAFGLLGIRFPRLTHLRCRSNDKRIVHVVAACVLHNWCLLEDDADESVFDLIENLETDVNDYMPASAIVGTCRANAGGNNKREMIANIL